MMDNFEKAYSKLLVVEGGYSNRPADRGGETFCGISRVHHPEWAGWSFIDGYKKRGVPSKFFKTDFVMDCVKGFYRKEYWNALKCDRIDDFVIAAEVFDSGVNCGKSNVVWWLQISLNLLQDDQRLKVDSIIGDKTIAVLNAYIASNGKPGLFKCLNGLQFEHYKDLVQNDHSQREFFKGWLRRIWEDHS